MLRCRTLELWQDQFRRRARVKDFDGVVNRRQIGAKLAKALLQLADFAAYFGAHFDRAEITSGSAMPKF